MEGYNLIQSDHPSSTKRGGVRIYYREFLAVRVVNIAFLNEYLVKLQYKIKKDMLLLCIDLATKALLNLNSFYLVWRTFLVIYFCQNPNSLLF